jgi:transcription-repair coupling factor (superfamily II helicase)
MSSTHPDAIGRLVAAPKLLRLEELLRDRNAVAVSGLWGSSVSAALAAVQKNLQRPLMVVCGHLDEADDLADDIELFLGRRPEVLPALELGGSLGRVSEEQVSNRLRLVARYASDEKPAEPRLLVAPIQSLMQSVPSRDQLGQLILNLRPGQSMEAEKLIVWLSEHGYNRLDQVEVPGDFAVRGGIIDVYIPGVWQQSGEQLGLTVRIDFFGDQIESIKRFNLDTLGSAENMDSVSIIDIKGALPATGESVSFFNYLAPDTIIAFWAPMEIAEQSKSYLDRLAEVKNFYPLEAIIRHASPFARMELSQFDQSSSFVETGAPRIRVPVGSLQRFETEAAKAITELAELTKTHDVTVFCENSGEKQRFTELMEQASTGLSANLQIDIGYLHRGFIWETENQRPLALLGHHELFHRYEQRRRVKRSSPPGRSIRSSISKPAITSFTSPTASPGSWACTDHQGRQQRGISHAAICRERVAARAGGAHQSDPEICRRVSGPSAAFAPGQRRVGKAESQGVRSGHGHGRGAAGSAGGARGRAGHGLSAGHRMAARIRSGVSLRADAGSGDQRRGDQAGHAEARPMDRLLCGDVGYGKTELAMRAAFKAMEYGKQVAVLVPTTVLAEQHYRSFKERMVNYPFIVDSISRFKSPKEQKETSSARPRARSTSSSARIGSSARM